ncbi:uncharacterized protein [Cardiocondyla obscurior]|uniref:uncharacterized protein n=1 Tax=Cardiocondyla obscurior TaxID=286306 RepID=UPI00396565E0
MVLAFQKSDASHGMVLAFQKRQILRQESQPDVKSDEGSIERCLPGASEEKCLERISNEKGTVKNILHYENDNNLVIDKTGVDIDNIKDHEPEGRRIIDVPYFLKEMHRTFDNHARGIECQFKDWILVNSQRHGLLTQFFFKCKMCHFETNIWSEPKRPDMLDINKATVAGTITVGIGYAQLQELYAAQNISIMSEPTYIQYRENILEDFQNTAMTNMITAGEAEKQLAIERNDVIDGIPYITVIADGSWMKRSYGTNYDSLSGVGAIIGYHTKKVLFVGVRNKYCSICNMAERKGIDAKAHKCYKNFNRNASSTRMESDAIAEGFNCSLEMHGLIYKTVIADGDSSVFQTILDNAPYEKQAVTVKKIECVNHLLRNLCKKLKTVSEMTQTKTNRQRGFVQTRNIVKINILNIRKEVQSLAELRRKESKPQHCKAKALQKDILNIPSHVFGEHRRCEALGRMCKSNKTEKNYVPYLKLFGLYEKIENAFIRLSGYSDSLLINCTNNPAESFNSIICKEISGKRINYGRRGSYNARIAGAVVQYNTQQVLTELHKNMCDSVPPIIEKLETRRQIKVARSREYRQTERKTKKFKKQASADCYYGPQSQKPDLPSDVVEQLRQYHVEQLEENANNSDVIEMLTRKQSESELWLSLRRKMLTASNFGTVCRMRPTTSCAATVKAILYPPFIDNEAVKYGLEMEEVARKELALQLKKEIRPCGMFIDNENPCLGASPDGVIDEDGLVEIKCPLSAENLTAESAVQTLTSLKSIFDKRNPNEMNKNHRYFYQVQGQLNITQRQYCVFVIWTPKSMKITFVNKDIAFWKNKMLPFLNRFYYDCMLSEILDSRHNRHMPIKDPEYVIEAKKKVAINESSQESNQQCARQVENLDEQDTFDMSCTKLEIDTIVKNMDQYDDCTYIGTTYQEIITEEDKKRRQINLDKIVIPLSLVRQNILSNDMLNDESLDSFLRVVRESSPFETQSVQYQSYPDIIEASKGNLSLQIIGGKSSHSKQFDALQEVMHWRCIFFDGIKLRMYDSISNSTYDSLAAKEKNYIRLRYSTVRQCDIIFEKVDVQPDAISCGIYTAAFATTVALEDNPCNIKYSTNVKCMRQHFMKIIEGNELLPFPTRE